MYRIAEKRINSGLSLGARILLGSVSALFGLIMILVAPPTEKQIYFFMFAAFCIAISIACFTKGKVRMFTGSLIGTALFIVALGYFADQLLNGGDLFSKRSEQSIFNSLLFFIFFGLPGISYTLRAKFGIGENSPNKSNQNGQ